MPTTLHATRLPQVEATDVLAALGELYATTAEIEAADYDELAQRAAERAATGDELALALVEECADWLDRTRA